MEPEINADKIDNGYTWEAMMQVLLSFIDPNIHIYSRPGRDSSIDALSGDGLTVYQAKHHKQNSMTKILSDAREELKKIEKYRKDKQYWRPVKNWIMFTNIDLNPEDEQKWNQEIVPLYIEENLSAILWDWGKIRSLLYENPTVISSFFYNEPRVFHTISDELRLQRELNWFPQALEVECVGRDEAFSKFIDFLESNKKIWAVSGAGGMGKSRFLLECAKKTSSEWTVYWTTAQQLQHFSYDGIIPEKPVVLFIDDLEKLDILLFIISEMFKGRMKNWKIVFTERISDSPCIKELQEIKYESIRFDPYLLPRLDKPTTEILLKSLLGSLSNIQFKDSIENIASKLWSVCEGIPLWAGLCVKLIYERGNLDELPKNAEELLKKYLEWFYQSLINTDINRSAAQNILRWIALFGKYEIENNDALSFLSGKVSLKKTQVLDILKLLVAKGIAFRVGANKKYIKIAPDPIRDIILKEALIDRDQPTEFAKEVVLVVLQENVPRVQEILRNLAIIEYIQFAYSDLQSKPIDLLSPIIESIEAFAKEGSTSNQLVAIELLDQFSFARVKESLKILWNCWSIERDSIVQDHPIWGKQIIAHKDVKNKVPWKLFAISQYVDKKTDKEEVYKFYLNIYEEEKKKGVNYTEGSENVEKLFGRTLFGEYWSYGKYNDLAMDKSNELIAKIENNRSLNLIDTFAFNTLMLGLTSADKMINGPTFDNRFTFGREYISIKSHKWSQLSKFKEKLKGLLNIPSLDPDLLNECAKIYANIIHSVNSGLLPKAKDQDNIQIINDFFVSEFQWSKEYFKSKGNLLPIIVRDTLRKSWQWHLEYSKDEHVKQAAEECENVYYIDDMHREIKNYFSYDRSYGKDAETKAKYFFEKWISGKSNDEIIAFLAKVSEYDPPGQYIVYVRALGRMLGEQLSKEEQFIELCQLLLVKPNRSYEFEFGIWVIKNYLSKIRSTDIDNAINLLKRCIAFTSDIPNLLFNYYQYAWQIEHISLGDLEIIKSRISQFENIHLKWGLLASIAFCFWPETQEIIDKAWNGLSENEKQTCLHAIIDESLFLENILNGFSWKKEHSQWMVEKIVSMEEIDWLEGENYNIENYLSLKGLRDIAWLMNTIEKREQLFGDAKVLPQYFRLTYFVKSDFNNRNDIEAYEKLIEISTGDSIISYYIPKYLCDLDPESTVLGHIVENKIVSTTDYNRIYRLTRIAGEFQSDTKTWDEISLATCKAIQRLKINEKDKLSLYGALGWSGVQSYSSGYGEIPSLYYEQVEEARKGLENEKNLERKEYWHKRLEWSKNNLSLAEEKAKEEREE